MKLHPHFGEHEQIFTHYSNIKLFKYKPQSKTRKSLY